MYDEDGNRRRLFSSSSVGGMSSCGSASSQARLSYKPDTFATGDHGKLFQQTHWTAECVNSFQWLQLWFQGIDRQPRARTEQSTADSIGMGACRLLIIAQLYAVHVTPTRISRAQASMTPFDITRRVQQRTYHGRRAAAGSAP